MRAPTEDTEFLGLELSTVVDTAPAHGIPEQGSQERWDTDPTTLAPGRPMTLLMPMVLPLPVDDDLDDPEDGFPAGSCRFPLTATSELTGPALPAEPDEASVEEEISRLDLGRAPVDLSRIAARIVVVLTLTVGVAVLTSTLTRFLAVAPVFSAILSAHFAFSMVLGLYGRRLCLALVCAAIAAGICLVPLPVMAAVVASGLPLLGACLYRASTR